MSTFWPFFCMFYIIGKWEICNWVPIIWFNCHWLLLVSVPSTFKSRENWSVSQRRIFQGHRHEWAHKHNKDKQMIKLTCKTKNKRTSQNFLFTFSNYVLLHCFQEPVNYLVVYLFSFYFIVSTLYRIWIEKFPHPNLTLPLTVIYAHCLRPHV